MSEEKNGEEASGSSKEQTINVQSSFWSFLEVAKQKSNEVYEFMKKDLGEISSVVKAEASSVVNSTTAAIKDTLKLDEPDGHANSVKRSVSSFLGTVGSVLSPMPEDDDQEAIQIQNDAPVKLSKLQLKLFELIKNENTYLADIDESLLPQYNSWLGISEDQLTTDRLSKHLVASPELHDLYETLVPDKVDHITFWRRYLFKKALLEDTEFKEQAKVKREMRQAEQIQWETEDFAKDIELTEEDQIKLLAEYENEKKQQQDGKGDKKTSDEGEVKSKLKKDMVIVSESNTSSHISTSSADTEGKDTSDDWENFDMEDTEEVTNS